MKEMQEREKWLDLEIHMKEERIFGGRGCGKGRGSQSLLSEEEEEERKWAMALPLKHDKQSSREGLVAG